MNPIKATKHGAEIFEMSEGWAVTSLQMDLGHYFVCRRTGGGVFHRSVCGEVASVWAPGEHQLYDVGVVDRCSDCASNAQYEKLDPPEDWKEYLLASLTVQSPRIGETSDRARADHVAARLARCTPNQTALLLAKYTLDAPSVHKVWSHWFRHLMAQGWETSKPGIIAGLTDVTLRDHLAPKKCKTCKGACYLGLANDQLCEECHGSGVKLTSSRGVARELGLGKGRLRDPWVDHLAWARAELWSWEVDGFFSMR